MNPLYYDVGKYLETYFQFSDGSRLTGGQNLSGGEWITDAEGNRVDKQVLLLEGVSPPSELKRLYEALSLQVLVRGEPREHDLFVNRRAKELMRFLLELPETVSMSGCIYKGFEQEQNLLQLGKDTNECFVYSFNLSTYRGV